MNDVAKIITELEHQRDAIDRALAALREISGEPQTSSAAIDRRSEGQRRRWAAKRAASAGTAAPAARKRGLTAAGRKRLSELMKARWASKNPPKKRAS